MSTATITAGSLQITVTLTDVYVNGVRVWPPLEEEEPKQPAPKPRARKQARPKRTGKRGR